MLQLEDKLYTSTEVADILGVSLRSVYRYLEENKLQADIKTATGRHRFSKRNILEFLYPDGNTQQPRHLEEERPLAPPVAQRLERVSNSMNDSARAGSSSTPINNFTATSNQALNPQEKSTPISEPVRKTVTPEPVKEPEVEEEPIDWLAKFREAARKYREEAEKSPEVSQPTPASTPAVESRKSDIFETAHRETPVAAPIHTPKPEVRHEVRKNFYRSSLGGLKDIAQNIDKSSRSSFLDYAFTLNAGLSLYKPIKPFSILHVYVRPGDLTFFERSLGLTPSDEHNAQLCLLVSDDNSIYSKKDELHGLFVVSKEKLYADIKASGDASLENDGASILN